MKDTKKKTISMRKKYVHKIDCGRGCRACGARMNRALSTPEMIYLLKFNRKKNEWIKTAISMFKIFNDPIL